MTPQQPQERSAWNRWLFFGFWGLILLELALLGYKYMPARSSNTLESFFLPGVETSRVNDLDPRLQQKLARVFRELNERGYEPQVTRAYRSSEMQDFYHELTKALNKLHLVDVVDAPPDRSCHSRSDGQGKPASTAVDVWGYPAGALLGSPLDSNLFKHAHFFKALGEIAEAEGLVWGGKWSNQHSMWQEHGLGYDPSHLQLGRCD